MKATGRLIILVLSSISLLITGCGGDSDDGATGWINGNPVSANDYLDEIDPTPSADRTYAYYVASHKEDVTQKGILRVNLGSATRQVMFEDGFLHSPTLSFDESRVAFLRSGKINYYELAADSTWESDISMAFTSIVYVNDTLLAGESQSAVYFIDEGSATTIMLEPGYDPTMFTRDTIAYLRRSSSQDYEVMLRGIGGGSRRVALLHYSGKPRWASVEPRWEKFVFALEGPLGFTIYSSQAGSAQINQIAASPFPKAHIYGPDQIIYSGPDGRFYRSNYNGSILTPMIPAVDPG